MTVNKSISWTGLALTFGLLLSACGTGGQPGAAKQTTLASSALPSGVAACFYEHINYAGNALCVSADSAWIGADWNDRVSSVRVSSGYQVELFQDANFGGGSLKLSADTASLVGLNFNDLASSFRVSVTGTIGDTSRPALSFADASTQGALGPAYTMALKNLLDINTVSYDPAQYNRSGLMSDPPGSFIRAGGGYAQPWTRDASLNSWNAASLLTPDVARNTLWSVVDKQSDGQLIVNQDNQLWDQVIWLTGAWNHYLLTGDRRFLESAYQTGVNTLALRKRLNFNATLGLFKGPSFFNDGIAGYPEPIADAGESKGSFVGSYPASGSMMALSTNALYYNAYRCAAQMAAELGRPASEVSGFNTAADALKGAINQRLWLPDKGTYGYFIHGEGSLAGTVDRSAEGTGLSFAILFGIADATQAKSILANTPVQPYGIVDVFPNFARYSNDKPGRHNNIVWPMIQGLWATAAARQGDGARFAREVLTLAKLANASRGFYEIYNAQTGAVDGGWQTGDHWPSAPDQTWSATAFLRMMYSGVFGLTPTTGGLTFAPMLPSGWGDATLSNVRYRNAVVTVKLHGAGNKISSFKLDGAETSDYRLPVGLSGPHTVDITLTGAS